MQLRVRGVDPLTHPIMQELERVKLYMKKLISVRDPQDECRPRVDTEVAERIVRFYTARDSQDNNSVNDKKRKSGVLQENDSQSEDDVVALPQLESDSSVEEVASITVQRRRPVGKATRGSGVKSSESALPR